MKDYLLHAVTSLSMASVGIVFRLILALLILIIGCKLVKMFVKHLKKPTSLGKIDATAKKFTLSLIKITLYVLVVFTSAATVGIPTASMLTLLGSCGLAIGLALQGGLSNLAGGFLIIIFKPFAVGDYISINEKEGFVEDINIFYTILKTREDTKIVIPNAEVTGKTLTDFSGFGARRVNMVYLTEYADNMENVKDAILTAAKSYECVLDTPAPYVFVSQHGSDGMQYTLYCWVKPNDYWDVSESINENVKHEFDKRGISIPYHKLDVNIKNGEH